MSEETNSGPRLERYVLPFTRSRRSSARLAAVQCVYGLSYLAEGGSLPPAMQVNAFLEQNDQRPQLPFEEFSANPKRADVEVMTKLVGGVVDSRAEIEDMIDNALPPGKPLARLEQVIQAILLCGVGELLHAPETDSAVIVNEYLNITHLYYGRGEVGLVNAVLDKIGKLLRN